MRPIGYWDAAALGADPIASPGSITDAMIIELPPQVPAANEHPADRTFFFTRTVAGGQAAGNVVGQLYALDESTAHLAAASRVWRKVGDALTIPNDAFKELEVTHGVATYGLMVHGKVFFRVTAGNAANLQVGVTIV